MRHQPSVMFTEPEIIISQDLSIRAYVKVYINGERHRFYNGKDIGINCNPNRAKSDENEEKAVGERRPRGHVRYPFTNQHLAQGYTKYSPLKSVYPQMFSSDHSENNSLIQLDIKEIDEELIKYLAVHPEFMRQLHSRKFEMLVAELFRNKGYEVQPTPETRDGGKDIIAVYKTPLGATDVYHRV